MVCTCWGVVIAADNVPPTAFKCVISPGVGVPQCRRSITLISTRWLFIYVMAGHVNNPDLEWQPPASVTATVNGKRGTKNHLLFGMWRIQLVLSPSSRLPLATFYAWGHRVHVRRGSHVSGSTGGSGDAGQLVRSLDDAGRKAMLLELIKCPSTAETLFQDADKDRNGIITKQFVACMRFLNMLGLWSCWPVAADKTTT